MNRTMIDLYLDLMSMSAKGFGCGDNIHPDLMRHTVPPIGQTINQAHYVILVPFMVKYHLIRRTQ